VKKGLRPPAKSMVTDVEEIVPAALPKVNPRLASLQGLDKIDLPATPQKEDYPLVASLPAAEAIEPPVASGPAPKVSHLSTTSGHLDFWSHPFFFHSYVSTVGL